MSSNYHVLCVSHDPAIVIEDGDAIVSSGEAIRKAQAGLVEHPSCDLLVGRYSYPLVEVCCFGNHVAQQIPCAHHVPIWAEAGFLRVALLALKYAPTDRAMQAALERVPSCWTGHRLQSLRLELLGVSPQ